MDIAVYLFTGFLESGKSTFIRETMNDPRFVNGEKTLLLLCEEGEAEFDIEKLREKQVFVEVIDEPSQLDAKNLSALCKKYKASRVVIEYNGMWQLGDLYSNMPDSWVLYQEITFADTGSFLSYNSNMRSLVVDKLQNCELVVFNRCKEDTDKNELHKIVRGVSRRCDILYEYENGEIEPDEIEDPLPFDIEAETIEIGINDYAIWYRDLIEEMEKYHKKTIKFTGILTIDKRMPADCFVIGRPVMTCCADDIAFKGILGTNRGNMMKSGDWVILTAEIRIEKHKLYKGEGPVLYLKDYSLTSEPNDPVATFY
ncbi:MAG: GTPase [Clostridia bacterium]|nr:GTPase [Clostridia bacterium]